MNCRIQLIYQIFERKLRCLDIQGACLYELRVKPTHSGVVRELQTFDGAWLSIADLDCNCKSCFQKAQLASALPDNQRKQFNSVSGLKEQISEF